MSVVKKIVVIGGTGLIGSKTVLRLRDAGHEVVAASPRTGIDSLTGEGLDAALAGADVVIDVTNVAKFEPEPVRRFFETSAGNIAAAEKRTKVAHHVVLSIVGADRAPGNFYFAAKVAQEATVKAAGVPYTIVRATQFIEFLSTLADFYTIDGTVRVPNCLLQPIAADDVADALVAAALSGPRNETFDIAGPERGSFEMVMRCHLGHSKDGRRAVADPARDYFGADTDEMSLVPLGDVRLGKIGVRDWHIRRVETAA